MNEPKNDISFFFVLAGVILVLALAFHFLTNMSEEYRQTMTFQQHHSCEFVLHKMPSLADSIDTMVLVSECAYTRDSLLPLVRGDVFRDLPEQR